MIGIDPMYVLVFGLGFLACFVICGLSMIAARDWRAAKERQALEDRRRLAKVEIDRVLSQSRERMKVMQGGGQSLRVVKDEGPDAA